MRLGDSSKISAAGGGFYPESWLLSLCWLLPSSPDQAAVLGRGWWVTSNGGDFRHMGLSLGFAGVVGMPGGERGERRGGSPEAGNDKLYLGKKMLRGAGG